MQAQSSVVHVDVFIFDEAPFMLKVKLCNAAFDKVSVNPSISVVHYPECHFLQL